MSGVERGVGYPEEAMSPLSDNCGEEGDDVLNLDEAMFLIIDSSESALEILAILPLLPE